MFKNRKQSDIKNNGSSGQQTRSMPTKSIVRGSGLHQPVGKDRPAIGLTIKPLTRTMGMNNSGSNNNLNNNNNNNNTTANMTKTSSVPMNKGFIKGKISQPKITPYDINGVFEEPIDLVYTWVDGGDEEWIMAKRKFQNTQRDIPEDSLLDCRWRDLDELRFSIESVYKFAPWIRTIFIISDYQRPYWFDENNPGKIVFIDHPDLFGEEMHDHLPTFNSHAIETHLHQIPGLSEYFIYANDDTFFGNMVQPTDFFTPDGRFKVFLTTDDMETEQSLKNFTQQKPQQNVFVKSNGKMNAKMNMTSTTTPIEPIDILPYFTAQAQVNSVLDQLFGKAHISRKRLKHQMKPLRKSVFEMCWENELTQMYLFTTSSTRFRSLTDIDPTSLVSHVGLLTGKAVPGTITSKYYALTDEGSVKRLFFHLFKFRPSPKLYCINDDTKNPDPKLIEAVKVGFEKFLPHRVDTTTNLNNNNNTESKNTSSSSSFSAPPRSNPNKLR